MTDTPESYNKVKSPFFAPRRKRAGNILGSVTPSITETDAESKSTLSGAIFNLINAIVGAGIVGIPYAFRQCSLSGGIFMIVFCVVLTIKSLCLLVETAKHVNVTTYERLSQVAFGHFGFVFMAASMFVMAYGAMVSYLMIVKDALPNLIGLSDKPRLVLFVSSFCLILPLSLQRDMANLSKSSVLSVLLDCVTIAIIVYMSPVQESAEDAGGLGTIFQEQPDITTFFIGIGILSFAFVCQHSAFMIAGSLQNPTRKRWNFTVTVALCTCGILALTCGFAGFIGFGDSTKGNILSNISSPVAQGCMCVCMFLVYPMESYVARHVIVVTLFQGRSAREGDDHTVLARSDRRIITTVVLYISALIPASLCGDLGNVLSLTGAVGGSALSYIGPGATYLGIHGEFFLKMVDPSSWNNSLLFNSLTWYLFGMPIWCYIATIGSENLRRHHQEQAILSPFPSRLKNVIHCNKHITQQKSCIRTKKFPVDIEQTVLSNAEMKPLLIRADSLPGSGTGSYKVQDGIAQISSELLKDEKVSKLNRNSQLWTMLPPSSYGTTKFLKGQQGNYEANITKQNEPVAMEDNREDDPPTLCLFLQSIFFIIFGVIAAFAGVFSVINTNTRTNVVPLT